MNKRTFLKLSSALVASPLLSPIKGCAQQEELKNWAGNLTYSTNDLDYAGSVEEVQKLVKKYDKIKTLGTRHCFNAIADSKNRFISLRNMNKVVSLDPESKTVTVEAGMKYGELSPYLHEKGYALHNLASLPHISIAGACATATHGSGVKNANLASAVSALEIVTADGSVIALSRDKDGERFNSIVVGLGALGVITRVTLDIQPAYMMRQHVYLMLPMSELKKNFEKIVSAGYSVSLFTDWQSESINEVWVKSVATDTSDADSPAEFFGGKAATKNMHPIADLSAENCTEQMGIAGPWYERLPHFRMGFTPSSGKELQAEYFVPMHHAADAVFAIQRLGASIGPHLFISEIRTIDQDHLWMSPCYHQPCLAIHFTWKQDWPAVSKLLPVIEKELKVYNARPHWGKLFSMSPDSLREVYQMLPEFKKMVSEYDPQGKFRNDFLSRILS